MRFTKAMPRICSWPASTHSAITVQAVGSMDTPRSANGRPRCSAGYQRPATASSTPMTAATGSAKKNELVISSAALSGRAATRRISGSVMPSSGRVWTMK